MALQRLLFRDNPGKPRRARRGPGQTRAEAIAAWVRAAHQLGEQARLLMRGLGDCDERAALEEGGRLVREASALVEVWRLGGARAVARAKGSPR